MSENAAFYYSIEVKKIERSDFYNTIIDIESDNFVCQDFYSELSKLLNKYIPIRQPTK